MQQWRTHREGLNGMITNEDGQHVITSGKGWSDGQDIWVLRCWDMANGSPGESRCKSI